MAFQPYLVDHFWSGILVYGLLRSVLVCKIWLRFHHHQIPSRFLRQLYIHLSELYIGINDEIISGGTAKLSVARRCYFSNAQSRHGKLRVGSTRLTQGHMVYCRLASGQVTHTSPRGTTRASKYKLLNSFLGFSQVFIIRMSYTRFKKFDPVFLGALPGPLSCSFSCHAVGPV